MIPHTQFTTPESKWQAVLQRDSRAENAFVYAVQTTGVYCRPGCSSRLPNRENVAFFPSPAAAENAGYRPCKRCTPGQTSPQETLTALIVHACRTIEQAETPPSLNTLAAAARLSPWHFQRTFKKIVGVTPKQYAATHQAQKFRAGLRDNQTVTAAIYDAGYGSSSRAYDHARDHLAMTPTDYRQKGAGLVIQYGIAPCYLGWVVVAMTGRGICAIEFSNDPHSLPAQVKKRFPQADLIDGGPEFDGTIAEVVAFLEAPQKGLKLPLDIQGTAFQKRVWQALQDIPAGATAGYGEIAERIGQPTAARAVAQACAANKLAVAVPCHRAVRQDGQLGGYRWGADRKQRLLDREAAHP